MITDLLITVGLPVLGMAMGERVFFFFLPPMKFTPLCSLLPEYIVAGHRFNIVEDFGCCPATYNTPLAYVLVWSWPLIIGVVSACYGGNFSPAFPPLQALIQKSCTPSTYHPRLRDEAEAV